MRNVSNAARRTHDRTGGQVYFPASQDIAGHGSGGRTSRPTNGEWAALLVASGPGPLLGKNSGGATATHGVLRCAIDCRVSSPEDWIFKPPYSDLTSDNSSLRFETM